MKKLTILLITLVILIGVPSDTMAAPSTAKNVTPGRSAQDNQSGVISPVLNPGVQLYHNVSQPVTLSGIITIAGPQLIFTVTDPKGNQVSDVKVTKISDETYSYSFVVPSSLKGLNTFTLNAKTIYSNGSVAGQTHTSAPIQTQSVRFAYVDHFDYSDFAWGTYDRANNQYPYSYNLIKVWVDGSQVPQNINGIISGTDTLHITGNDPTYDGGSVDIDSITPPINIRGFSTTQNPNWTNYNRVQNTFALSFDLIKDLSNGEQETVTIQETAVDASQVYNYTANDSRSPEYSQNFSFVAPVVFRDFSLVTDSAQWVYNNSTHMYDLTFSILKTLSDGSSETLPQTSNGWAPSTTKDVSITMEELTHSFCFTSPASPIPASVNGSVSNIQSKWDGKSGNINEEYTLTYVINGQQFTKVLKTNFTKETGFQDQNLIFNTTYNGQSVIVNYTLPYQEPLS